jgi:type I restriction enzyme S subunit
MVPPLELQDRITGFIRAYDLLIENNCRRIRLLEDVVKQVYREWFVRLRFPGHEHSVPENGVPKGWMRSTIAECTEFLSRGISPTYDDDASGLVLNQKCIRGGLLDLGPARHQSKKPPASKMVQVGDVLVNSTGAGTLGRVAQVMEEIGDCTVDSHITIVRSKAELSASWFGMTLVSMQSLIEGMGKGATNQTELSKTDLGEVKLIVPPISLAMEFEQLVSPLRRQTQVLRNQNVALEKGRDLLLPRLMSGEIEV